MNYITLSQLSDKIGGRARSSIYRDIESGRLPKPIKFGSRLYWDEAAIDAAIQSIAG
ncbi:helix-turn-helix transcriptional regulator [Loktanella sp. DJP18]|uniref:helix-turn-helix transcriptional regulator n=1 Tax=Loktanella sp. DJP18 TaxID=3409788 RepID=UPI003BB6F0D8